MNCDDYRQSVSGFVDEELGNAESRQLFRHLGTCDECWRYYRRITQLRNVLATESEPAGQQTESRQRRPVTTAGATKWPDRPPERQWIKQRLAVSPASFLLTGFVAFLAGVLLVLMLSSRSSAPVPGLDDRWAGEQLESSKYYPMHTTTTHVAPPMRQQ
jgi:anti-sigma factor RsiW